MINRAFRQARTTVRPGGRGVRRQLARSLQTRGLYTSNYRVFGATWDFPAAGPTPDLPPGLTGAIRDVAGFIQRGGPRRAGAQSVDIGPFTLTLDQSKIYFFDRPLANRILNPFVHAVYSRFGAFVRSDARNSMRRAAWGTVTMRHGPYAGIPLRTQIPSDPGTPPRTRVGLIKRFIFFRLDPTTQSVVIGPTRLRGHRMSGGWTVPAIQEYGPRTGSHRGVYRGVDYNVVYPARPYMRPAMDRNVEKMTEIMRYARRRVGGTYGGGMPTFRFFGAGPTARMNL